MHTCMDEKSVVAGRIELAPAFIREGEARKHAVVG